MNSDDVNTSQWLNALDEVLGLNPKFIIPGHGSHLPRRGRPLPSPVTTLLMSAAP